MESLPRSEGLDLEHAAMNFAAKDGSTAYWRIRAAFIAGAEWARELPPQKADDDLAPPLTDSILQRHGGQLKGILGRVEELEVGVANHVWRIDRLMERLDRMESWARTVPSIQRFDESEPESERWRR